MAEKRIETVEMRAGDVKTGFGNPRKITKKKKDELRNSIETFGDFGSFIIDENDNIIGGNMRLSVIKEMDPDTVILCKRLIGYTNAAMGVIAQQDEDIDMLLAALEKVLAEANGNADGEEESETKEDGCDEEDEEENNDSSDDESKSLNADSADKIIRQRLSICRVGDKLNMDGLEDMSIKQAKKAIIAKVLPNMRMDGKSDAYIDAMYDLAVAEANKHKGVAYQRNQMTAQAPKKRADSNESMAANSRKNMIAREGGNE